MAAVVKDSEPQLAIILCSLVVQQETKAVEDSGTTEKIDHLLMSF